MKTNPLNKIADKFENKLRKISTATASDPLLVTESFTMPSSKGGVYTLSPGRVITFTGDFDSDGNPMYKIIGWGGGSRFVPVAENLDKIVNLTHFFKQLKSEFQNWGYDAKITTEGNSFTISTPNMKYKISFDWKKKGFEDLGPDIKLESEVLPLEGDIEDQEEVRYGSLEPVELQPEDFTNVNTFYQKIR